MSVREKISRINFDGVLAFLAILSTFGVFVTVIFCAGRLYERRHPPHGLKHAICDSYCVETGRQYCLGMPIDLEGCRR